MTINVQKIKFAKAGMAESCSPKVDVSLKNSVNKSNRVRTIDAFSLVLVPNIDYYTCIFVLE